MSEPDELLRRAARPPSDLAVGRVLRRAERTLDTGPARGPRLLVGLFAVGTVAAMAALAFTWSPPTRPTFTTLDVAAVAIGADVQLFPKGEGSYSGGDGQPRIQWESGTLRVEVAPNRGVDLEVETPDAVARVVGTGFTVLRDAHGTRVEVLHGTVHTLCRDGREARLGVGESLECLPTTSGGMLAHARALEAEGAPDDVVLAALEAGLRLEPDGGVIRPELAARRISVLARSGRTNEAAAAAEAWLAGPDTVRREQIRTLALELAVQAGDCDRARALGGTGDTLGACATNP